MAKELRNRKSKEELKALLMKENFERKTVSFYRYVKIENPQDLRNQLYAEWEKMGVFGRIYLSYEGVNAQMSVPKNHWDEFVTKLYAHTYFTDVPFKVAVEDNGKSFYKLIIKVRDKIVADGIDDPTFDATNTGAYLNAKEFNDYLDKPNTIVVDMRNHYESEVGKFENAFCPDADTFKEELPLVIEHLQGQEDNNVLMYQ